MTGARDKQAILKDRLDTVLAITDANAEEARARANVGGAEIVSLSAEDRAEQAGADAHAEAAEARLEAARSRIADLEARLVRLDRELAAADS